MLSTKPAIVLLAILFLAGCRHSVPPVVSSRHPAAKRIVAIGDLHGDLEATRAALRLAGAIGDGDRWTGGDLVVVQTGDQLDRGDDERAILDLFVRLAAEARAAGGAFHALNGNHETLGVLGDYKLTVPAQLSAYADVTVRSPLAERVPEAHRHRAAALMPGGQYAQVLAKRDVVVVVGETVFVHGGLSYEHVEYGLDRINDEVRDWISAKTPVIPAMATSRTGPLWTRALGGPSVEPAACRDLARALAAVGAKRVVIGHTIQAQGINAACDGAVWRIDVALSKAIEKPEKKLQVLEISGARVQPLPAP